MLLEHFLHLFISFNGIEFTLITFSTRVDIQNQVPLEIHVMSGKGGVAMIYNMTYKERIYVNVKCVAF